MTWRDDLKTLFETGDIILESSMYQLIDDIPDATAINNALAAKLDKTSSANILYSTDLSGNQTTTAKSTYLLATAIQDNLTSQGVTTQALAANQGYVLANMISQVASGIGQTRGSVVNALTSQQQVYSVATVSVADAGSGYIQGDSVAYTESGSLVDALFIVDAVDGSGAVTAISVSMAGAFSTDLTNPLILYGGSGTGLKVDVTTTQGASETLNDIPNPRANDIAYVLSDELHGDTKTIWIYADFNGDGIYNWVYLITYSTAERNFVVDPIETGEIAGEAVTTAKIADEAITSDKLDSDLLGELSASKRYATVVIGSAGSGYTSDEVDFLCDGTNDLTKFNAALAALPATGGEIKILDGTYNLSASFTISKSNVRLCGCGTNTILKRTGQTTNTILIENSVVGIASNTSDCTIANLTITSDAMENNIYGVYVQASSCQRNQIINNTIAVREIGNETNSSYSIGIRDLGQYTEVGNNNISNSHMLTNQCNGIEANGYHTHIVGNRIANKATGDAGTYGMIIDADYAIVSGNRISNESSGTGFSVGARINSSDKLIFTDNYFSNTSTSGTSTALNIVGENATIANNYCRNSSSGGECRAIDISGDTNTLMANVIDNTSAGGKVFGIILRNTDNGIIAGNIFAGKTATVTNNFCLRVQYPTSAYDNYIQFTNNNLRNWTSYGAIAYTTDGTSAATLPGSATTIGTFATGIGTGSVAGFNIV